MWRNTDSGYGWVAILLHWTVAVAVFGLFALGLWMTGLTYYSEWYNLAPHVHQSVGLILAAVIVFRLAWRLGNRHPAFEPTMKDWERIGAVAAHWGMYALIATLLATGYVIPTAGGDPVAVFDWFTVPAIGRFDSASVDLAGAIHYWGAWALMALVAMHTLAALKHHFIDRDRTLRKMLGPRS